MVIANLHPGIRRLTREWRRTLVSIVIIALSVGCATAVFGVIDATLLRPLPFPNAGRLVVIPVGMPFANRAMSMRPDFLDVEEAREAFAHVGAYAVGSANLELRVGSEHVTVAQVTQGFFASLGVTPELGRVFVPEEERRGAPDAALISGRLWRDVFGGAKDAMGRSLMLNGRSYAVVGVMRPGFSFPGNTDVWIPMTIPGSDATSDMFHGAVGVTILGSLANGISLTGAQRTMRTLVRMHNPHRAQADLPSDTITSLQQLLAGDVSPVMTFLVCTVIVVLLVACINVAMTLLVKSMERQRDFTMRMTLGAAPSHAVKLVLLDGATLGVLSSVGAIVVAAVLLQPLRALIPSDTLLVARIGIDWRVLAAGVALSILTGLIVSIFPAVRVARRTDLSTALKVLSRQSTESGDIRLWQRLMIGAEVALATFLAIECGLFVRSFRHAMSTNVGIDASNVQTMTASLPYASYPTKESVSKFARQVVDHLDTQPGVLDAAAVSDLPLRSRSSGRSTFTVVGGPPVAPNGLPAAKEVAVTGSYFDVMHIAVLRGGGIRSAFDGNTGIYPAVISHAAAVRYWPNQDPIGSRFTFVGDTHERTVVAEVADVKNETIEEQPGPKIYLPFGGAPSWLLSFVVRQHDRETVGAPVLQAAVRSVDPGLSAFALTSMSTIEHEALDQRRDTTTVILLFAVVASAIAMLGVYTVVRYAVVRRRRELAIRLALGATLSRVHLSLIAFGMEPGLIGCAAGLIAAYAIGHLVQGLLYDVAPLDALTFATVAALSCCLVLAACYFPARRMGRVALAAVLHAE